MQTVPAVTTATEMARARARARETGDGDGDGDGEAGNSDVAFMVTSDTAAVASLDVGVSVDSDVVPVSGLDDVTDAARANAAKLGRDDAILGAGAGPGMGGAFCDEGTVAGRGDVPSYVDSVPGMRDAIGSANSKAVRFCDRSKLTGAGGVSFASRFGMIPGATLVRLAGDQAQLLEIIDIKVSSESVRQPAAGAGGISSPLAELRSKTPRYVLVSSWPGQGTSVLLSCPG